MKRKSAGQASIPAKKINAKVLFHGYLVPSDCEFERLPLAVKNAFPRDKSIIFRDRDHKYFVNGVDNYTSCTTFVKNFFDEFDSEKQATKMVHNPNFPRAERYAKYRSLCTYDENGQLICDQKLVEKVLQNWEENRVLQSNLGTLLHRNIELYFNNMPLLAEVSETKEYGHFKKYESATCKTWIPFRTEMMVWDEEFRVCGSVDMIYIDASSVADIDDWRKGKVRIKIHLVDWKRSRRITKYSYGKYGRGPCADVPGANFYKYSLQLNIYKYILEKRYNIDVLSMTIAVFHPSNDTFLTFSVDNDQSRVQKMMSSFQSRNNRVTS